MTLSCIPLAHVTAASDMIRNDKIAELLEQRRAMDLKQLNKVLPFIRHPKQSLLLWLVDIVCIPLERRQFSIHSVCGMCVVL